MLNIYLFFHITYIMNLPIIISKVLQGKFQVAQILIYFAIIVLVVSQDCDKHCFCSKSKIICDAKNSRNFFPKRYTYSTSATTKEYFEIAVSNFNFTDSTLRRRDITSLHPVDKITIYGTTLNRIEPNAFRDCRTKLQELDLTNNQIKYIEDNTFNGLKLKSLSLSKNKGIQFSVKSFYNLSVDDLYLDNCGIVTIQYEVIAPLIDKNLRHISLSENKIETLNPQFEKMLEKNNEIILSSNPLACLCSIKWLHRYAKLLSATSSSRTTCAWPEKFTGRSFEGIEPDELSCDLPQFTSVTVLFETFTLAKLMCSARGYPTPIMAWYYHGDESTTLPAEYNHNTPLLNSFNNYNKMQQLASTEIFFRQTNELISQGIVCVAYNEAGRVTLQVNVTWPTTNDDVYDKTAIGELVASSDNSEHKKKTKTHLPIVENYPPLYTTAVGDNNDHPFLIKYYTLLELICAIIGTFVTTLVLSLSSCCFVRYIRKRKMKPKPQWSTTYESAYGGSHEYDVPRLEQNNSYRPMCPTNVEYLDFRNQQKLYSQL